MSIGDPCRSGVILVPLVVLMAVAGIIVGHQLSASGSHAQAVVQRQRVAAAREMALGAEALVPGSVLVLESWTLSRRTVADGDELAAQGPFGRYRILIRSGQREERFDATH